MKNNKIAGTMLAAVSTLALVPSLTSAYYIQGGMMDGYGYGYGHEFAGGIMMIFTTLLVVFGIYTLLKFIRHDQVGGEHNTHNSAMDILRERYAKGEIEKEEFESKKKDLAG